MRDRLIGLLEKADLALASVSGMVEEQDLAPLIAAVTGVRTRLVYPEDVLVVALAGGTGSGKSSLFNALCDEELVDVGGVRPTTSHPAAAIPESVGSSLDGYLDRLGVAERHVYDGSRLCLIDLPDTDSVELEHRHRVDTLLPLVDVVVWVTDPEKYRDARLHQEYLAPLSEYSAQFVFVLNQADRLTASQADEVGDDLRAALEEDGVEEARVVMTAAAPPAGPPIGLESVLDALDSKRQSSLYGKLLTDLAATSRRLESVAGHGLDFDERAGQAVDEAAGAMAEGDAPGATDLLTGFIESLQADTGGVTADKLAVIAADVPGHIRRIDAEVTASKASAPWRWLRWRGVGNDPAPGRDATWIAPLLTEAIVRPARAVVARRAVAVASVADLAVEVEGLRTARD
jgi:GTP-binding protein EngB required for normal cell division